MASHALKREAPALKIILLEAFAYIPGQQNAPAPAVVREAVLYREQKIVRCFAAELDAVSVSFQAEFDRTMTCREPAYWIWDGTHPTEAGHVLIAGQFFRYTKEIFGYETPVFSS